MKALVAVAAAQTLDLVTLFAGLALGAVGLEQNATVRAAWSFGGAYLVLGYKSALLVAMLAGVDRLRHAPQAWIRVAAPTLGIGVGLAGATANLVVVAVVLGVIR